MLVHGIGKRAKFWNWDHEDEVEGTLCGRDSSTNYWNPRTR